ncbi:OmpA family protein [Simplicispira psychrophila]|uniref:OmpA family protein n=1 Tax=Simplicispira psychrophila TaxID=80882 RepID=UPI00048018D9|nr:OmpA family protein [Simplicispira psychrophila]
MSSSSSDDSQERFALGFLFALIILILSTVVGVVVYKRGITPAPVASSIAAPANMPAAVEIVTNVEDGPSVRVEDGIVKFYFASGQADIAAGANDALADVVAGVTAGKKAVISGFHDDTGGAAMNAELAKQRAFAVRDALMALGVTEAQIELNKPEQMQASGSNPEARRVEVMLSAD